MIESHIHEWVNLLIRWIHFIVGVAWIGASFYFNWLENNLNRRDSEDGEIAGSLWALHGGGFYRLKKFKTGPKTLPDELHWFKWEAYTTWLSGITLLVIVYYFNAKLFLIDPAVMALEPASAITVAIISVLGSWFVYDALCRTPLRQSKLLLALAVAVYLALLAWFLSNIFSGRAAYIHVGAAIGTMMVGNVLFVIIPAQKEMVRALKEHRVIDPTVGKNGLLRSTHNNYLTLPVLFIMISNHFPSTYGHEWNWSILVLVSLIGVAVRHYFNRRAVIKSLWWILPLMFVAMVGLMWATGPQPSANINQGQSADQAPDIFPIVQSRCAVCHSASPSQSGFSAPPAGLTMDTMDQIKVNSTRIYQAAVITKTMPIGNLTEMTEDERSLISRWYQSLSGAE